MSDRHANPDAEVDGEPHGGNKETRRDRHDWRARQPGARPTSSGSAWSVQPRAVCSSLGVLTSPARTTGFATLGLSQGCLKVEPGRTDTQAGGHAPCLVNIEPLDRTAPRDGRGCESGKIRLPPTLFATFDRPFWRKSLLPVDVATLSPPPFATSPLPSGKTGKDKTAGQRPYR